ncbi:transmembrane protein 100 [Garra rufa]|uniref:transmembrane protein 100 n=1 Tax=Garra rufa TaxID=137080 RepID=UPI003CCE62AE
MMATPVDPSADSSLTQTVKYDPKSETVTLPNGLVSVAGVTVVTGGAELSCGSCMLAFGVWGTLVGLSVVLVGLWDHLKYINSGPSHLLALGLVLLLSSLGMVVVIFVVRFTMKKRRMTARRERAEANLVLVNEYAEVVLKRVTV